VLFFKRRTAARPKETDVKPPDGLTLGYL